MKSRRGGTSMNRNRRCENCDKELSCQWWELSHKEEIPVPGEGGGIHTRHLAQFCDPVCFGQWQAKRERGA